MSILNVCTKREYEKDGIKKVKWYKVGFLKEAESGRKYIKLFHQPETEFFVFENDAKETSVAPDSN